MSQDGTFLGLKWMQTKQQYESHTAKSSSFENGLKPSLECSWRRWTILGSALQLQIGKFEKFAGGERSCSDSAHLTSPEEDGWWPLIQGLRTIALECPPTILPTLSHPSKPSFFSDVGPQFWIIFQLYSPQTEFYILLRLLERYELPYQYKIID